MDTLEESNTNSKEVTDLINDKLSERIVADSLFGDVSHELTNIIKGKEYSKEKIEKLLRKKKNEDTGT